MWESWKPLQTSVFFHPDEGSITPLRRGGNVAMLGTFATTFDLDERVEQTTEPTAEGLWDALTTRLRETLGEEFERWFAYAEPQSLSNGALHVSLPNDFTREWVEGHFRNAVANAAQDSLGRELAVSFEVSDRNMVTAGASASPVPPATERAVESNRPYRDAAEELNRKYTFDLFVIGSSNRFAHAAALAVAEAPAQAYNPLFIYGDTGLGKTHLLQAIAHYVRQHSRRLTNRYITCESFMNDFIEAVRDRGARIEGFKRRYRNYDVLLIDDIQFLEGKERIQEEFFHTFNSLYEAGAQIIISSDRPPREIATLEERLRSRFEWGLITDIQKPDLETRIAILLKKVNTEGIAVDDPEVLTFIAGRVSSNIRELEGALTRVVAFSSLTNRPMTVDLAEHVLKDVFPQGDAAPEVTIKRIQDIVSQRFNVTIDELISPRRSQAVAYPRQVAMYLSRELTDSSLPAIGREFGGRDHTTVIHAKDKITRRIREDRSVYNLVQELTARIKQAR